MGGEIVCFVKPAEGDNSISTISLRRKPPEENIRCLLRVLVKLWSNPLSDAFSSRALLILGRGLRNLIDRNGNRDVQRRIRQVML